MNALLKTVILASCLMTGSCSGNKDFLRFVNPFIGTAGDGNTYPGAAWPYGAVKLSPDTRLSGPGMYSGYYYPDSSIIGFSHTHLNGVGEPEYRDILFMPFTGKFKTDPGKDGDPHSGYRSAFDHSSEKAWPGYYSVFLKDPGVLAEMTVTPRCGFHRYTFPETDSAHIIIDLVCPGGAEELYIGIVSDNEIEGLRRSHGWAWDQYVYFVARFSAPFRYCSFLQNDSLVKDVKEVKGKNVKAVVSFSTLKDKPVLVKVGISAVSCEGARKNLDAEIAGWNFGRVVSDAGKAWNKELSKIEVSTAGKERMTIFYTSMYHAFLSPDLFSDIDGSYRGVDHKIHSSGSRPHYTVFSLWDTFRALHPLHTIINRKLTGDFISSLLQMYDDGGRLPMWPLAGNYTDDMLGYHSIPVIADAFIKGIRDFDTIKAWEAMEHSAGLDKLGLKYYKKIGYLPCDRQGESVSKTLEYCYDDWCIGQVALALGKEKEYENYNQRAHNYMNVFDPETGFMRGRKTDRSWLEPFSPEVNSAYSEGNAWQYMFVPHDLAGLTALEGGDQKFTAWLDSLFRPRPADSREGMIGRYWHGNEPGHHLPYLYDYTGAAWKTQQTVHNILTTLYKDDHDGLAGNEDCGQMSAWYILSSMGFYPVTPGMDIYAIGIPLFDKAVINLEDGRKFCILAKGLSDENHFIHSSKLNGKPWNKSYLRHSDIMAGGVLEFEMSPEPSGSWAKEPGDRPYTRNGRAVPSQPCISSGDTIFTESTTISLACETKGAMIKYSTGDGNHGDTSFLYSGPITLHESQVLRIQAFDSNMFPGTIVSIPVRKAVCSEPVLVRNVQPGLRYEYFVKFFVTTDDLELVNPEKTGIISSFSLEPRLSETYFGFRYSGYLKVPADGIYTFYLGSNDGSRLFIDGKELIENDGNHAAVEEPGQTALKAGLHEVMVKYIQCGGGKDLMVSWSGPGFSKHEINYNELFHSDQ